MGVNDLIAVSRSADSYNTPYLNGQPGAPVLAGTDYTGNYLTSILELCYRLAGSPADLNNGTIGHTFYGSRLSDAQHAVMNTVWQYFIANVGGTF
jgi:hypothetical protein